MLNRMDELKEYESLLNELLKDVEEVDEDELKKIQEKYEEDEEY